MAEQDYYSILEINRNASQDEIKKAYRRLALKYHPDRNNGDKAAEEKFKQINAAYEVLGNEEKKRVYDQVGHEAYTHQGMGGGAGPDMGGFGDLGDLFGSMFGDMFGGGGRRRRSGPVQGEDLEYQLEISFEDAVFGCEKDIQFRHHDTCSHCHGEGCEPGTSRKTCPRCQGTGQILMSQGGFFQMRTTCPSCGGVGSVIEKPCLQCGGKGRVTTLKKLGLHIPAGVDTGSRLRSPNNGEAGVHGGPPGDLYVRLSVQDHPIFKRDDLDIHCTVPIPFATAVLGGDIDVPTVYGKERLTIPAGTQNGTTFTLRGKGVQSLTSRNRKGAEIVHIVVEVPTTLSSAQKSILKQFAQSCTGLESQRCTEFKAKAAKYMK
ncbi:MAG: molecular chaperone DnaJ [Victivallales bacterium]|nr:molecular chaperone DnaJ [Victivallales bacterium]